MSKCSVFVKSVVLSMFVVSSGTSGCSPGEGATATGGATGTTAPQGPFSPTGSMTVKRQEHTATLLLNGKVLIAGGTADMISVLASAELYQ